MNLPVRNPAVVLPEEELRQPRGVNVSVEPEPNCACGCPSVAHYTPGLHTDSAVWHGCMSCDDCEGFWSMT